MSLSELTSIQKKAVARVLLELANADGTITEEEKMLFNTMKAFDFFSESEIEEAKHMSVTHCITIIRDLPYSDKESLFHYMMSMCDIDGWNEEEVRVILTICKGAEIPLPEEIAKYL